MLRLKEKVSLALPDGHLMNHVVKFLNGAGFDFKGYTLKNLDRRPVMENKTDEARTIFPHPERVAVKVIRPQDMPAHVANGNFDLAVSGTDWLAEHRIRFPTSPVLTEPYLTLGFGKVRIVAAAHQDFGQNLAECIPNIRIREKRPFIKIASEYIYLADDFAQKQRLSPYRIIMTYGATESLVPEDCDLIIENTETGNTLRQNNLAIVETLMHSEACLIVNRESLEVDCKRPLLEGLKNLFAFYQGA